MPADLRRLYDRRIGSLDRMIALHDVDLFGIYVTPAAACLLAGLILLVPARWLLDLVHIDRFVWNRALFDLAVLIALTSGLVLSLRFGGT